MFRKPKPKRFEAGTKQTSFDDLAESRKKIESYDRAAESTREYVEEKVAKALPEFKTFTEPERRQVIEQLKGSVFLEDMLVGKPISRERRESLNKVIEFALMLAKKKQG